MEDSRTQVRRQGAAMQAGIVALLIVTGVMLLALFSRTAPHPPLEVAPFALAPLLGASLATGAAALCLLRDATRLAHALAILFAATGLVSFGPQKYLDPAFSRIWPAVLAAQAAIAVIIACSALAARR